MSNIVPIIFPEIVCKKIRSEIRDNFKSLLSEKTSHTESYIYAVAHDKNRNLSAELCKKVYYILKQLFEENNLNFNHNLCDFDSIFKQEKEVS